MIIRIVKMEFRPESVLEFRAVFNRIKDKVAGFEGCMHLELLNESGTSEVLFTYSVWRDEASLNKYRFSELFRTTWSEIKPLFLLPAEAWSLESIERVKTYEQVRNY